VWGGNTASGPTMSKVAERGMPYLIESPFQGSDIESLDNTTSTSDQIFINLTYRDPSRPWRDFIAYNVRRRNQGTTSAKRPIKNARYNLASKSKNKATYVVDGVTYKNVCLIKPLHTREEIVAMGYDGSLWDEAAALMAKNKIRVGENTIPVDVITVKVDYSDSTNANDCGACNIMNASYRALGGKYLTPAQRYFDGTYTLGDIELTGLQMNHSTANHPIAMFRDPDGTGANTYFYAKGNWKEDKGEQVALGFKDTPGYNLGCLNYQDESFTEYFGLPEDNTIEKVVARFRAEDPNNFDQYHPVLLSMYCGSSYKFMRWQNGAWVDTTGTMRQVNGRWEITGDVLNPVDGYELLAYTGMDWFMGVTSVEDMMAPVETSASWVQKLEASGLVTGPYPAWTQFFECMVDSDQLQIDLAMGKKVPYNLYAFLRFCNSCDYTKVSGFKSIWYNNLRYFANPRALMVYDGFTDYLLAIDQQAKNMQPMFFLDEGQSVINGIYQCSWRSTNFSGYNPALVMYPNKVYDADGLLGKDNDGGATVDPEVDPNKPTDISTGYNNPYAGYGSILWNNIYQQPTVLDDAGAEISMQTVIAALRSAQATFDGLTMAPFSPEGAMHFFMDNICRKWQKTVSSYDGERKFIQFTPTADAIYFYALHGLRLTSIPAIINTRFRFRDGYYRTGLFFTGVFSARINCASGAGITIKAAKTGYFGLGIDSSGDLKESVYLEAGQSHTFTRFNRTDGTSIEGALLYIYQCDRIAEINFNEISLSDVANFNVFTLAEKIEVGGSGHVTMGIGSYGALRNLNLGELPFLRHLDIRETVITNVNASKCPRLETLLAEGSQLTNLSLAETSPVSSLTLPSTVTTLTMVNLPRLSYPGGLQFDGGMSNITRLMVGGCPLIDGAQLLSDIVAAGAEIERLRLADLNVLGSSATLEALMDMGVRGLAADGTAYDETVQCSGLTGTWVMVEYISTTLLANIRRYFPELDVYNAQYTGMVFDDTMTDDANMTNLENGTSGANGNNKYTPSGHISLIKSMIHSYKCTFVPASGDNEDYMQAEQIDDNDINYLKSGDYLDRTDADGLGYDIMTKLPHFWYKGINDHLNQRKYLFLSAESETPRSSATTVRRVMSSNIIIGESKSVTGENFAVGDVFDAENLSSNVSYNTCRFDVEGMKQVRWPGVSSSALACLFLDADGKVINKLVVNITNANNDYVAGDYLFTSVPAGAKWLVFTALASGNGECIGVDSTAIEAIEPDWVENEPSLVGTYFASNITKTIDGKTVPVLRSLSGKGIRWGTNSDGAASGWVYDSEGNLDISKNGSDASTVSKWSWIDFRNLCYMRGAGYQLIDYEQHKVYAILWMAVHGRRNIGAVIGAAGFNTATGGSDSTHLKDGSRRSLGIEDPWGNGWCWMDNVAVNVASYAAYRRNKCNVPSGSSVDNIWRIYDPIHKTERAVRGVAGSTEIARVRWGRYCDVVPSKLVDNSNYNTYYCDQQEYSASTGLVVSRGGGSTSASGGLVYVSPSRASSVANGGSGARLAFRGVIVER